MSDLGRIDMRIAILFPLITVAAGDDANGVALKRRAEQRGISASLVTVSRPESVGDADVYLIGGDGSAGLTELVAALRSSGIAERVRSGRSVVFAVDTGMIALGMGWTDENGARQRGLELLPLSAKVRRTAPRSVATLPKASLGLPAMVGWRSEGFEVIPKAGHEPLAGLDPRIDPTNGFDGAVSERIIATGLHGPVLSLNPELADLILGRALGRSGWEPLPLPGAELARDRRITEIVAEGPVRRKPWAGRRS